MLLQVEGSPYDMTVTKYGFFPATAEDVEVTEDGTTTQDFTLEAAPSQLVNGTVRDAQGNWPLYARIQISGPGYPGSTIWTRSGDGLLQRDARGGPHVHVPDQRGLAGLRAGRRSGSAGLAAGRRAVPGPELDAGSESRDVQCPGLHADTGWSVRRLQRRSRSGRLDGDQRQHGRRRVPDRVGDRRRR